MSAARPDMFDVRRAAAEALSTFATRLADALVAEQAAAENEYIELRTPTGMHDVGDGLTRAKTLAAVARAVRAAAAPRRKAKT